MTSKIPKRTVDMSVVDKEDRAYVKAIIVGVLNYHDPAPVLNVRIFPTPNHYNVAFLNWDQAIDDTKWYETFLKTSGQNVRSTIYDYVISTETTPHPNIDEDDDESTCGPIKLFRIARGGYDTHKKRK